MQIQNSFNTSVVLHNQQLFNPKEIQILIQKLQGHGSPKLKEKMQLLLKTIKLAAKAIYSPELQTLLQVIALAVDSLLKKSFSKKKEWKGKACELTSDMASLKEELESVQE